jgi:hypothetical protein
VHIGKSVYSTVVFLGYADPSSPGKIACEGTGFLIRHDTAGFVATARHVAEKLGSDPFVIRANRRGKAELIEKDGVEWFTPEDKTVDMAIAQVDLLPADGFDGAHITKDACLTPADMRGVELGDECYTVGLFRFIYGDHENLPLVHTGNIALLPPAGEKIPVGTESGEVEYVEAHLIESRAIDGASGSPVFVRASQLITGDYVRTDVSPHEIKRDVATLVSQNRVHLLGLFQAAWFLPPDAVLAKGVKARKSDKVPVGFGVVVPAYKLIELLERDDVRKIKSEGVKRVIAATPTGVAAGADPPANDANPKHRGDFMRLVDVAGRKREQED